MTPANGGSRGHRSVARLLFFLGWLSGCATAEPEPAPAPAPAPLSAPTDAYFTVEQAERGQRVFTTVCSVCHRSTEFTGPIFAFTWRAEPVGNLFEHVSTTMPQDDPGSLSSVEYAAVVAYLIQLNGRAAGDRELPTDPALLARMRW